MNPQVILPHIKKSCCNLARFMDLFFPFDFPLTTHGNSLGFSLPSPFSSFIKGLVTYYGEGGCLQNGRGGRKSFSHAEGGAQKVWGSFYGIA